MSFILSSFLVLEMNPPKALAFFRSSAICPLLSRSDLISDFDYSIEEKYKSSTGFVFIGKRFEKRCGLCLYVDNQIFIGGDAHDTELKDSWTITSKARSEGPVNEQAIANMYSVLRSEMNQLYSKITELEMEVSGHSLVIGAIQPLDPTRHCCRIIGGVLVERIIREVLPAVQRNKEGPEEVIARLNEALEKKRK